MTAESIITMGIVGLVSFFGGVFSSWAKRGSKHCDTHQEFLLSIRDMSMEIKRLLTCGTELFNKMDKITDKQIQIEQRLTLSEFRLDELTKGKN